MAKSYILHMLPNSASHEIADLGTVRSESRLRAHRRCVQILLRALAARKMPRERNLKYRHAAGKPIIRVLFRAHKLKDQVAGRACLWRNLHWRKSCEYY